jgi:hypothetical protein
MTLALDGYDILRRIGSSPEAFSGLRGTIAEVAEELVKTQLTSKNLDLATFRALVIALGDDTVSLVLQTLAADDLHAIAALLDPHHVRLAQRETSWIEGHLFDLAHYRTDPAAPAGKRRGPGKATKPRGAGKRKAAIPFGTGSMGAKGGPQGE